jgi:RHS repeat-associated protein
MTSMPHLAEMRWDHADRFRYADRAGGGDVYFVYDASGQRVRKAYEHGGLLEERLYLGDFELYRRRNLATGDIAFARETLHVMSDHSRVALAETLIVDVEFPGFTLYARFRYQLESHLKSIVLEVDETGTIITYEEYLPFGGNAFRAGASMLERPPKTYRYCGLERDNETGLSYAAARYLSSWLARWTAADPLGTQGGTNQYCYCGNNPTCRSDPNGTDWGWDSINPWKIAKGAAKAAYHMVVDTGERAVDITTQSASALGHATGWYDIGYTEWSPESQRIRATLDENQQATTWSLIREGVYNNTVGGTVNMAKGIASGDPDAIGAGFLVLGLSMAGGGNNPRFNLPVPVFQMARAPGLDVAIPVLRSRRSPLPYLRRKLSLQHRSARG